MNHKIAVIDDFMEPRHHVQIETTAAACGFQVRWFTAEPSPAEISDCEVLYGHPSPALLSALANLKWFCCVYAGVEPYVKENTLPPNCLLSNSSGAYGVTITEHIIMVSLMLLRRLPDYQAQMKQGDWNLNLPMRSLRGSSITVMGTGDIGNTFTHRCRAFSPKTILGVNRSGHNPNDLYDKCFSFTELDSVLPNTDLLILAMPHTNETVHLLSQQAIAQLPRHACVVNVGRGDAIDQMALAEALNDERISGAALDVLTQEPPLADDPIRSAKHLILTPHIAGNMALGYTCDKDVSMFCDDLRRFANGEPLSQAVNRALGY